MSCYSPVPLTLYKDSYRDRQVEEEENEYVVVAKGNAITSVERVSDYAVLRAAQLMKQEGFEYFAVSKEIQDFAVGKALSTEVGYGYVATGVVDVRNPVTGLLVVGYNEKPELEDKNKSKIYKTTDVLKELGHYVDEERPKKFDSGTTAVAVTTAVSIFASVGLVIWVIAFL
jgi:hypothetical protein